MLQKERLISLLLTIAVQLLTTFLPQPHPKRNTPRIDRKAEKNILLGFQGERTGRRKLYPHLVRYIIRRNVCSLVASLVAYREQQWPYLCQPWDSTMLA